MDKVEYEMIIYRSGRVKKKMWKLLNKLIHSGKLPNEYLNAIERYF